MAHPPEKMIDQIRERLWKDWEWYSDKLLCRWVFTHINKTGGSSIENALGMRFEHKTALEKRENLGEWLWNKKYHFTFVRNPWDKVASQYYYRVMTGQNGLGDGHIGFNDWVRAAFRDKHPQYNDDHRMFRAQWAWIVDENGESMVDFIGRFERIREDFADLCSHLGVNAELPRTKVSKRERPQYQDEYDEDARDIIAEVFADDIVHLGYTFE